MTDTQMKVAAKKFAKEWKGTWSEKQHTQSFWNDLLHNVFGVENTKDYIEYERKVQFENSHGFIDGYISKSKVLIEQKNSDKSLTEKEPQSDGKSLTPFEQAERYDRSFPSSQKATWIITCNFQEFYIYDREKPFSKPVIVKLEELADKLDSLRFLIDDTVKGVQQELKISKKAGDIVGDLYNAILKQYIDPDSDKTRRDINVLCVRLVFCLYAEDAGVFGEHLKFGKYLEKFTAPQTREALKKLFRVLDQKQEERDPYLKTDDPLLASFPYVNGNLFKGEYEIPTITDEIRDILLRKASFGFDWSEINPTIFGAIFESTLNDDTRKNGGMHYTMPENIHKVIDPLFLDDLTGELDTIIANPIDIDRRKLLTKYQEKLSELTFLDPACGSGNFLTETYTSLRRLENKVISELGRIIANSGELDKGRKKDTSRNFYALPDQTVLGDKDWNPISPIKVSIEQFYGIEINDFAVSVSKTALWIAESQMMKETEEIINQDLDFLPLKTNAHIHKDNALTCDWEDIVPKNELSYIMGNPPFVGASMMSKTQKDEAVAIFGKGKRVNSIDYVGAWYYKAAQLMQSTNIHAALVSTNSITQGEQVAPLWQRLFEEYHIHIDFAYRTFRWDSEANMKAHVHCVIIGFSSAASTKECRLYSDGQVKLVKQISPYLIDAPVVFISSRGTPICDAPKMTYGNKPSDGGYLILSEQERSDILENDPNVTQCIRRYVGSKDYINNNEIRYCLWLKGISPSVYRKNPEIMRRLQAVRETRLSSSAAPTRAFADKPYLFFSAPQTDEDYLCIPEVSSERRRYIPIGFMHADIIASNKLLIIPGACIYHFGVLISSVHMAWTRAVTGRLEMRYQYSSAVVYNNFPWCSPTDAQKAKIEKTAQAILDARALYPDASLADMYGEQMYFYPALVEAHEANDAAVAEAYGIPKDMPEPEVVAMLMRMYRELTDE